jgi:hypothetical protein
MPDDLLRTRTRVEQTLLAEVPEGATVRLTCGWEDGDVVLRLLARAGDEESLWEWVMGDD